MGAVTTRISRPAFVADPHSIVRNSGRQIDWANVPESARETPVVTQTVTVGAAGAAGGATTVPVAALTALIKAGTTLDFGGAKFARLTADAAAAAVTLTVTALPTALVSGDAALATVTPASGPKKLQAGTVVGELLGGGKVGPRIATTNPATGILESMAVEGLASNALSGHGVIVGGVLYEPLLPDATGNPRTLASAIKTELNANGYAWLFLAYSDSRAA